MSSGGGSGGSGGSAAGAGGGKRKRRTNHFGAALAKLARVCEELDSAEGGGGEEEARASASAAIRAAIRGLERARENVRAALEEVEDFGGDQDGFYDEDTECAGYLVCKAKLSMGVGGKADEETMDACEAED